jgi:Sulphur transport
VAIAMKPMRVTAVHMGIVAGLLAVAAGTFFDVRPPEAYGICMACHGRDLVDWIVNRFSGMHLEIADASLVFPALTTIGAVVGAFIAARANREFRWRTPENPWKTFFLGALVMISALIAGGCSIRLLLRTAAGDPVGLIAFAAMAAGVVLGTYWLRWRAMR